MDKSDVLGYVKKAVPWLAAAASGNVPALITMAADTVSTALGVKVEPSGDAVATAVAGATPAELMALKAMENEFALKMQEMGYKNAADLNAGAYADIADARARDVDLIKVTGKQNYRGNAMAVFAMLLVLIGLSIVVWSTGMDDFAKGSITLIVGRALGWVEQIFSFEFGTTRSSKGKDDTINSLAQK